MNNSLYRLKRTSKLTRSTLSRAVCLLLVSSMIHAGCATSHYKEAADKETYGILGQKSADVPNMEPEFTIDTDKAWEPLVGLPVLEDSGRPMGPPESPQETGYPVLPLEKALEIAVCNSRTYQNEKELLYLTALDLSLNRHQFGPRFSATASGDYARDTTVGSGPSDLTEHVDNARDVASAIDALTGTPADLITAYADLVEGVGAVTGADEAQTIMQDEMPLIYLYNQPWFFAMRANVSGFVISPDGMIRLAGLKKQ